jgi:hypothetical protein
MLWSLWAWTEEVGEANPDRWRGGLGFIDAEEEDDNLLSWEEVDGFIDCETQGVESAVYSWEDDHSFDDEPWIDEENYIVIESLNAKSEGRISEKVTGRWENEEIITIIITAVGYSIGIVEEEAGWRFQENVIGAAGGEEEAVGRHFEGSLATIFIIGAKEVIEEKEGWLWYIMNSFNRIIVMWLKMRFTI